ncbi:MAG: CHAD domain-containing protein, partial [Roseiarcus sp.]
AACRVCLHDFMLNAAGLVAGPDSDPIEAVHQGRIALRRLRAAFALFRPIIRDNSFARMNAELKWLAGVFGAARDRDVMSLNAATADRFEAGDAKGFFTWLENRRLTAHRTVVRATRSKRWRIFLIDFCEWIDGGAWRDSVGGRKDDMRRFVRKRLKKRRDALLEKGRDLESLAHEARHNARIIAKKLRYAAQFFARLPQVADPGQMEQLLDGLDELQAALGELQDEQARLAAARADIIAWRKAVGEADPAAIAAAERWAAPALNGDKQLNKAADAYAKVARAKPF